MHIITRVHGIGSRWCRRSIPLLAGLLMLGASPILKASDWKWDDEVGLATAVKDGYEAEYKFIPGTDRDGKPVTVDSLLFPCSCTVYTFKVVAAKSGGKAVLKVLVKAKPAKSQSEEIRFMVFGKTTDVHPKELRILMDNPAD